MFNKLIPSFQDIKDLKQPVVEGEVNLLKSLDTALKKDETFREDANLTKYKGCLKFVQPFLNSNPDII